MPKSGALAISDLPVTQLSQRHFGKWKTISALLFHCNRWLVWKGMKISYWERESNTHHKPDIQMCQFVEHTKLQGNRWDSIEAKVDITNRVLQLHNPETKYEYTPVMEARVCISFSKLFKIKTKPALFYKSRTLCFLTFLKQFCGVKIMETLPVKAACPGVLIPK